SHELRACPHMPIVGGLANSDRNPRTDCHIMQSMAKCIEWRATHQGIDGAALVPDLLGRKNAPSMKLSNDRVYVIATHCRWVAVAQKSPQDGADGPGLFAAIDLANRVTTI